MLAAVAMQLVPGRGPLLLPLEALVTIRISRSAHHAPDGRRGRALRDSSRSARRRGQRRLLFPVDVRHLPWALLGSTTPAACNSSTAARAAPCTTLDPSSRGAFQFQSDDWWRTRGPNVPLERNRLDRQRAARAFALDRVSPQSSRWWHLCSFIASIPRDRGASEEYKPVLTSGNRRQKIALPRFQQQPRSPPPIWHRWFAAPATFSYPAFSDVRTPADAQRRALVVVRGALPDCSSANSFHPSLPYAADSCWRPGSGPSCSGRRWAVVKLDMPPAAYSSPPPTAFLASFRPSGPQGCSSPC